MVDRSDLRRAVQGRRLVDAAVIELGDDEPVERSA